MQCGFFRADGKIRRENSFKAGSEFSAQMENAIDAENNKVGDDVNFTLTEDFKGEGGTIAKGSEIFGRVVNVEKAAAGNKNSAKITIMFDFFKKDDDFITLSANIVSIEKSADEIKFEPSATYSGGTILSVKGKNLKVDKGAVFRIKLAENIVEK